MESFARALRTLRASRGNPTLVQIGKAANVSKSVVGDALKGHRLPSEQTTRGVAASLGDDPAPWLARRERILQNATRPGQPPPAQQSPTTPWWRRPVPLWLLVVAVALAILLGAVVARLVPAPGAPRAEMTAVDGVDPMITSCKNDAVVAASVNRHGDDFTVQMLYSAACMAAWGRVTRNDGRAAGESLEMFIYPEVDRSSPRSQRRKAFDVQSVYTTLLIEPAVEARVCGLAQATIDGDPVELGPFVCI